MIKALKSSAVLLGALWVGGLFCLGFIIAPYLFTLAKHKTAAVPHTGVAADLIGPLLYGSDVVGLVVAAVLVLALVALRRQNEVPLGGRLYLSEIALGVAFVCAAVDYFVFTPRLHDLRGQLAEKYGGFHLADRADPLFAQFDGLHQTATTLFMIGFAAALLCLLCMTQFRSRPTNDGAAVA
jgi:hypothetical protein